MIEKKIPFDINLLDEIKEGKYKVQNKKGNPVRILDVNKQSYDNKPDEKPIGAYVKDNGGYEYFATYTTNGQFHISLPTNDDLILVEVIPTSDEVTHGDDECPGDEVSEVANHPDEVFISPLTYLDTKVNTVISTCHEKAKTLEEKATNFIDGTEVDITGKYEAGYNQPITELFLPIPEDVITNLGLAPGEEAIITVRKLRRCSNCAFAQIFGDEMKCYHHPEAVHNPYESKIDYAIPCGNHRTPREKDTEEFLQAKEKLIEAKTLIKQIYEQHPELKNYGL